MAGSAEKTFDNIEHGLEGQVSERDIKHAYSLHGSKAAYRRAITELLFFASVGGELQASIFHPASQKSRCEAPLLAVQDIFNDYMIRVSNRCCDLQML